jgi:tripeptide aminopeptidase
MNEQRLLERFLRYIEIDTTAREDAADYPSSPGQLKLGAMLVDELHEMGIDDARQDEHGIVLATVPASTEGSDAPAIAFCAHLDTSPETSGADVKPQVIRNYAGGDIRLPADPDQVITVADNRELEKLTGSTLITSDGTTLLGADDKAGIAVIMEAVQYLGGHPEIEHGRVRICFTCDEEIGRGVDHVTPGQIDAAVCYTLDGGGADEIDVETFSADLAIVTIRGVNIHPSIAKGRMTNAVRVAADFLSRLPRDTLAPESTAHREGFLHPYEIRGGVDEVSLRILLRDFQAAKLECMADTLREAITQTNAQFPEAQIEISIRPQYRNMADGLAKEPRAVAYAERALARLGRSPKLTIVRGGTDGSRLTELGLPTPNLSSGQHTPHSRLEWACLDEMVLAVRWLVELCKVWAETTAP